MSNHTTAVTFSERDAEQVVELASFLYQFCQVERATFLPDGKNPETDSDHTVVLSVVALSLAMRYFPHLDSGLVAKFCLVHDLVEAYAGDTDTMLIDEVGRQAKELREAESLERMAMELGSSFPELIELIRSYERLDTPEARFVKMLDKLMPAVSHILNGGATLHRARIDLEARRAGTVERTQRYLSTSYGRNFPELLELRELLRPLLEEAVFGVPRSGQHNGDPI